MESSRQSNNDICSCASCYRTHTIVSWLFILPESTSLCFRKFYSFCPTGISWSKSPTCLYHISWPDWTYHTTIDFSFEESTCHFDLPRCPSISPYLDTSVLLHVSKSSSEPLTIPFRMRSGPPPRIRHVKSKQITCLIGWLETLFCWGDPTFVVSHASHPRSRIQSLQMQPVQHHPDRPRVSSD